MCLKSCALSGELLGFLLLYLGPILLGDGGQRGKLLRDEMLGRDLLVQQLLRVGGGKVDWATVQCPGGGSGAAAP